MRADLVESAVDPATRSDVALHTRDVVKVYGSGPNSVRALDGVSVDIPAGHWTAVMGPSGSGKSTLMHVMAGLDRVTSGGVWLGDTEITTLSERELTHLRRRRIGFVFQAFNLVPTLTARENILLPITLGRGKVDPHWFDQVIDATRLHDRLSFRPTALSGGQQQRVALARAVVARPDVLFADEPTGNLDSRRGGEVLDLLRSTVDDYGQTVVMVTHDPGAAARADRVVFLADGRIVDTIVAPTAEDVLRRVVSLGG